MTRFIVVEEVFNENRCVRPRKYYADLALRVGENVHSAADRLRESVLSVLHPKGMVNVLPASEIDRETIEQDIEECARLHAYAESIDLGLCKLFQFPKTYHIR